MPVDPRSELPVRIAKSLAEVVGQKINPSQLYTYDGSPLGGWDASRRFDYEHEAENRYLFHYRRVTCFNLLQDTSVNPVGAIPLQVKFNEEENQRVFARCAIHEVYQSPNEMVLGQGNPTFDPNMAPCMRKIGLEVTLDLDSPIRPITLTNGNFIVFSGSTGQAVQFDPLLMQYSPREHGTRLVNFATEYIGESFKPNFDEIVLRP